MAQLATEARDNPQTYNCEEKNNQSYDDFKSFKGYTESGKKGRK